MSIADLMNTSKPLTKIHLKGGQTEGRIRFGETDRNNHRLLEGNKQRGQDYCIPFIVDDDERYEAPEQSRSTLPAVSAGLEDPGTSYLSQLDTLTSIGTAPNMDDLNREELTEIYDNYSFNPPAVVLDLSVMNHRDEILSRIVSTDILIITGSTGCGKTTQVPQFILDSHAEKRTHCNIVVTQPRKIAAISVAKRVCEERGWEVGTVVGYQVGLDKTVSPDTRLLYCTTGVLLQKLILSKSFEPYTHIILDEVHERDEEMDFTMLVVRYFYRRQIYPVKIILMSATIDTNRFSKYFALKVRGALTDAPVFNLASVENYPVHTFYLDDMPILSAEHEKEILRDDPAISPQLYTFVVTLIETFLNDLDEKENVINNRNVNLKGSVLVFLPGIREIECLYEKLNRRKIENPKKCNFWLCPLHSSITSDEQLKVFHRPPPGVRKIILSTNIAESSITVVDIKYVIDFCLTKVLVSDEETNFSSLQLSWASKNSCKQRAGRAGRVMEGRVYRLVTKEMFRNLPEESSPELCRCPLSQVVLKTKILDLGEPKAILALALDPPDLYKVQQTILLLKELGALLLTVNGQLTPDDGDITYIGKLMAALPLDVRITKLIFLGHMFGVLEEAIIMGCAMSVKNVFREPFREQMQIYNSKLTWADSSCSDLISFLNAYQVWRAETTQGKFERNTRSAETWARRYYIDLKGLQELSRLEEEIKLRLKEFHIELVEGSRIVKWNDMEKPLILKVAIAGAFYPNYFTRSARAGQIDEREAVKILDGKDPYTTVYLRNMPDPAAFYTSQVRKALEPSSRQMKLSTNGHGKLFVEFPHCGSEVSRMANGKNLVGDIPGKITMPVYRAVKLRQLKVPITIHALRREEAAKRMRNLKLSDSSVAVQRLNKTLPAIDENIIEIIITHVENAGHFWCQKSSAVEDQRLVYIQDLLQRKGDLAPLNRPPEIGQILAAPFTDGGSTMYYRSRVTARVTDDKYEIYFIDYGNTVVIPISDLRDFGRMSPDEREELQTEPDAAMECVLAEVQPSLIRNQKGLWTPDAAQVLIKLQLSNVPVLANVYSVVNGVLHLEIYLDDRMTEGKNITLNQLLVDKGFAQRSEESYLSKMNHASRLRYMEGTSDKNPKDVYDNFQLEQSKSLEMNVEQPRSSDCRDIFRLKGPESPLEMTVHSITRASFGKKVVIDWASVNSVLLDAYPQDPHERLLVAGTVSINSSSNQLNLRHTTMMPNIHGLSAILCMLFAPKIELRTNRNMTRLTGALCGLGVDDKGRAIHAANDIELTFDCEIELDDIELINKVRFWMNSRLCSTQYANIEDITLADILHYQQKIADTLYRLLRKQRESQKVIYNEDAYTWGQLPKSLLLSPARFESSMRCINPVFDLHWGININDDDSEEIAELYKHLQKLSSYLVMGAVAKDITCILCDVENDTIPLLRLHLQTTQHKELKSKITKRAKQLGLAK